MTATLPKIPDPLVVLRRAERKHTSEEPRDLDHLADAVRAQIVEPLTAGGRPVVDDVQVKQLTFDKQRLDDLVTELRKHVAARDKTIDRQTREIADLKQQLAAADEDTRRRIDAAVGAIKGTADAMAGKVDELRTALTLRTQELDEARAERDTARAQLRDAGPRPDGELDRLQADNARLADELTCARRDLRAANATLDEIADEQASQPAHVHRYPVDLATGQRGPCSCRKPWMRDLIEDGDEVVPDVEPLDQLFARIRDELGETS